MHLLTQGLSLVTCHTCSCAFLLESFLLFCLHLSFPVFFFSFRPHCELHSELDNLIAMQNLRYFANKGSVDVHDVSVSLTGYEPNFMTFSELNDSLGSFFHNIPSSDQALGKLLTEALRGQADHCELTCQSSSSLLWSTDQGNLWEKEMSINQLVLGSRETRTVLTASFLKPQAEKPPKLRKC